MLSQKILSPPTNVGLPGPLISKPASRDVLCCLIVDSTSSLRDHFKNIQQSFLTPFLSQLRLPLPVEFEGQITKFTPSLKLGVVTYGDYLSNSPVVSHYFTSEHKLVLDYLNSLKFDNGGPCYSVVYEGLCSALEMFDSYQEQSGSESNIEPIRHCILIGNSLPHACNVKFNQKEENDNLSVQGICQKLKKYNVNFSLISTNKLLESLFVIPSLVNSESIPVLDYFRAGFDNYIAKLAGVVPPENFKAPGWLRIEDKDKRKFKDYDSEVIAELKKKKPNFNETESSNSFTRPQDISRSNFSGPTPPSLSTPIQNSRGISAPRTPNTTEGLGHLGSQPCASPASDLYSTPLTNNHVGESSPLAAKTSTTPLANVSSLDALNNNSDSSAMRRQSSSKSSRGGTRKSSGPKKPTKAQLKAQAKAAAANSPLSSVSNILKSPEASHTTVDLSKQTTPQASSTTVSQIPQDIGEKNTTNVPSIVPSITNSTPQISVANQQNIPDNSLKSPQVNLPTNLNPNALHPLAGQNGSIGPLRSPNFSAPNTPNDQNVSKLSTPVQQPNNISSTQNAMPNQNNNSSTVPANNQTIPNNPMDPTKPPGNVPPTGNAQPNPGQTQNATPNTGTTRQPTNPVWQGLIRSKPTPDNAQELVGGIAVHSIDPSDAVRASFMTELWPKCLQLSSLIPCNVTNIMSFCRNMQVPFFLIGTPQSMPDPPTNNKIVSSILSKIQEKTGVIKIEITVNGNNNHGLLLFRLNNRLLGTAFFKIPFPDFKVQLFAPIPSQTTPSNISNNAVASASSTNPQQIQQPNAFVQQQQHQQQQPLSGPTLNQGLPMNMNAGGFNQLMAQNMAASGNLKNPQAMAMFQGMPMNLANQAQNVNNGMFMNNPGMVNPAMAMFNMEAQRRAQQTNGGMNPFNGMPAGMNMQQFNQMQNQNNFMLPQQLQQLAQFQLAQRQQAARPPNPRNPPQ